MQRFEDSQVQINPLTKLLVLCLFGSLLIFFVPQKTLAQSTSNITVSPQLIQLDLSTDPAEAEYTYTNNTGQTIELKFTMQDVKELEDRGIPGILDPNESRDYNFGLSDWARFSTNSLILAPRESKSVTVFIDRKRLTLGGHYATVLAELQQKDEQKTVKLRAILSTLLFVRAGSEYEQEQANIVQISNNSGLFSFPSTVTFRLQNTGNVDLTPYGTVSITNPLGDEVARGIINEDSLITLPDSTRRYITKINKYADVVLPGIYKTTVKLKYGKNKFSLTDSSYFFILGELNKYIVIGTVSIVLLTASAIILRKKRRK